jgi:hypothetical protein
VHVAVGFYERARFDGTDACGVAAGFAASVDGAGVAGSIAVPCALAIDVAIACGVAINGPAVRIAGTVANAGSFARHGPLERATAHRCRRH